ncbi:MAG: SDR family oxidoreductase [Acidobacteriota bacterium]|nr:SDR family oxidoreductase [Acidobacteriota bacterium]
MLLITGGSGFVGQNLARYFAPRRQTVTTYFTHPPPASAERSIHLDIRDAEAMFSIFDQVRPAAVIHAAGNKNLRFCEEQPDEAFRVNAGGTQNVARACRRVGAKLIYLSTDLVFSCVEGNYQEHDVPEPTLAYGKSKLLGEKFALEKLDQVAVCRSGGIYGKGSPLLQWFVGEIEAGQTVECFTDVFNTPTYVDNLGEMMETVLEKQLVGVFHTVGRERVSRFEFFRAYAETLGLDVSLLSPVSFKDLKDTLLLQPDSSLAIAETAKKLRLTFNSVGEGFTRLQESGGV